MIEIILIIAMLVLAGFLYKNRKTLEDKIKAELVIIKTDIAKLEDKIKSEVKSDTPTE